MLDSKVILAIVTSFYQKATQDILIGYHFRNITDFDEHLPHIADFWNMQINGVMPKDKQFELLSKHLALNLLPGHLNRWIVLFHETLSEYLKQNLITQQQLDIWLAKIEFFKIRFNSIPKMLER